jgi:hypothetical protein|tara:strand:+ start:1947 stop:2270 length:324 start_codon:yes stop_codon:yes gene_type:complete
MTKKYAQGAYAYGFCDRCGFRYDLHELKREVEDQRLNGLRVCETCLDVDHPQLRLGEIPIDDPQALFDPRPDIAQTASRGLFGWRPVGDNVLLEGTGVVGTVTVTTS